MNDKPVQVLIVCGSKRDLPTLERTMELLDRFGVVHEVAVASAHRVPARVHELCGRVASEGIPVVIAAAGHAAHLAGVIAALVSVPVIGVPIPSSDLDGLDSLLAMVQMPSGVPVAVMALGLAGATNVAVFATQILATTDPALVEALRAYKRELADR